MKVLLFGPNGQVGWELQRSLAPLGELAALDRRGKNGLCGDLNDLDALRATVGNFQPAVIVNAAAYTAVDRAEEEHDLATRINADAPAVLAEQARTVDALLVHYSTDYVFDGRGDTPWLETDTPSPLNHYGASKLAGERHIQSSGCRHLILRTSWVYAAKGHNFLATMVRLMQERDALQVIDDQIGAPTGAELIADITAHAIRKLQHNPALGGLYHLAADGETSWHGYASYIAQCLEALGCEPKTSPHRIKAIPTSAWPTPAARPLNSRLDCRKLETTFGLQMPAWRDGVGRALVEMVRS